MVAPDPAALVAAAVRAACLAKAPRRTIQGVAAAVVSVLMNPSPAAAAPRMVRAETAGDPGATSAAGDHVTEQRRAARAAKRRQKRQRKRAAQAPAACKPVQEVDTAPRGAAGGAEHAEQEESTGNTTPRKVPVAQERDPSGETAPGKRFCEAPQSSKAAETVAERRLSDVSQASDLSGITVYTDSEGGTSKRAAKLTWDGTRRIRVPPRHGRPE